MKNSLTRHILFKKIIYKSSLLIPIFLKVNRSYLNEITNLGDANANWSFLNSKSLKGSTLVSAGVGENISFELDFLEKFNANLVLIDPTVRAINYFNSIIEKEKYKSFLDKITYIDKALWINNDNLLFYSPFNPEDVSMSLIQSQVGTSVESAIVVDTISFNNLLTKFDLNNNKFKMIKLDIEGAEYQVLMDILKWKVKPEQILVEFDFMRSSLIVSRFLLRKLNSRLNEAGYYLINRSNGFDFLYLLIK